LRFWVSGSRLCVLGFGFWIQGSWFLSVCSVVNACGGEPVEAGCSYGALQLVQDVEHAAVLMAVGGWGLGVKGWGLGVGGWGLGVGGWGLRVGVWGLGFWFMVQKAMHADLAPHCMTWPCSSGQLQQHACQTAAEAAAAAAAADEAAKCNCCSIWPYREIEMRSIMEG
jgi:hypothetical protein